jgi:hypothetical protein
MDLCYVHVIGVQVIFSEEFLIKYTTFSLKTKKNIAWLRGSRSIDVIRQIRQLKLKAVA